MDIITYDTDHEIDYDAAGAAASEASPYTPEVNSRWRMKGTAALVDVVAVEKRGRGYRVLTVDANGDVLTGRYHRLKDFLNIFEVA